MRSTRAIGLMIVVSLSFVGCLRPVAPPQALLPQHEDDVVVPGRTGTLNPDGFEPAAESAGYAGGEGNMARHTFSEIGRDFDPDISSDGESLIFASTRNARHPDIYIKAVDGQTLTLLAPDASDDVQPRFSPDGERVAFASNRAGNWDIWLVRRDGSVLSQLTRERADEVAPTWAPDGRQIAYSVWSPRASQWEIWVMDVEHPGVRRFITQGMFPAWSPDGKRIAFQRARERGSRWFGIWTIDLDGDEARNPTEIAFNDAAACVAPRWSPDGRWLVYSAVTGKRAVPIFSEESSQAELWAADAQSGVTMKLTSVSTPAFNPAWGSDGRVYFVCAPGGRENIWSVDSNLASSGFAKNAMRKRAAHADKETTAARAP